MPTLASHHRPTRRAFTLVEVMTVIVIIILLLGIGLAIGPEVLGMGEKRLTYQIMSIMDSVNEEYRAKTGHYIDIASSGSESLSIQQFIDKARAIPDLMAMLNTIDDNYMAGSVNTSGVSTVQVLDAWGSPLIYIDEDGAGSNFPPNKNYFVSKGPDGKVGNYATLQSQLQNKQTLSDTAKQAADNLYSFELTQ